jgi:hypothetical protein
MRVDTTHSLPGQGGVPGRAFTARSRAPGGGTLLRDMRRDQLPPNPTATYVMQRWQAMYVSVNKAACTSLKWLVADLQGEDRERFHRSLSREVSRTMTVHRRSLWQHTPMAKQLGDEELAALDPDNGWFVFGVVRHPTARMFSAWQSKLLLREPWWIDEFGDEPWFPRVPERPEDIVEQWMTFVRAIAADPRQRIMANRHFAPQKGMLAVGRTPYTRVYRTNEMKQLLADLEGHVRARGYDGPPLELLRANETPLKPIRALFGPEVLELSQRLYADDFDAFGYDDVMPGGLSDAGAYTPEEVADVARLVERAERINDLAMRARSFKRRSEEERARAKERRAAAAANGRRPGLLRRLRARI